MYSAHDVPANAMAQSTTTASIGTAKYHGYTFQHYTITKQINAATRMKQIHTYNPPSHICHVPSLPKNDSPLTF
eukprot:13223306-Ditylum_brightwellii.AAC.1